MNGVIFVFIIVPSLFRFYHYYVYLLCPSDIFFRKVVFVLPVIAVVFWIDYHIAQMPLSTFAYLVDVLLTFVQSSENESSPVGWCKIVVVLSTSLNENLSVVGFVDVTAFWSQVLEDVFVIP